MSESTLIRYAPSTTIISTRSIGPRGLPGRDVDVSPGSPYLGPPPFDHPSLFRGAVAGGPPAIGDADVGDWCIDVTNGCYWVCIVSGTPGDWTRVGGPGAETLTLSSAADQVGLTAATTITGLGAFAPAYISARSQDIEVKVGKIRLTAGSPPLSFAIILYEDPGGAILDSITSGAIQSVSSSGGLNSITPPMIKVTRTAAQLAGKTFRVDFLPNSTGTFSILGSHISNKVFMREV